MNNAAFFKSIVDQDTAPIVVCDLEHRIVYANPVAVAHYRSRGFEYDLIGRDVRLCHGALSAQRLQDMVDWFLQSPENNRIFTRHNDAENKDDYMVALRDDRGTLIGYYGKHEFRTAEVAQPYAMLA